MKKVLVVNPPSRDVSINRDMAGGLGYSAGEGVVLPPLDLLNMATTLSKKKYQVIFNDSVAQKSTNEEVYKIIENNKVEVVIGNLSLPTIDEDMEFYAGMRRRFKKLVIYAKTGISYQIILEKFLKKTNINGIIFSEVDLSIADYIEGRNNSGMVYRKGRRVVYKEKESVNLVDLDGLPIPNRALVDINLYRYGLIPGKVTTIQTSRGCPYPCGYYCPYPLVQGKLWRKMSPKRVILEIESIVKLGIKNILFRDATFTLDMGRANEICELLIKKKIKVKWWCETRINVLDEKLLMIMKKSGCLGINVGVETMDKDLIGSEGKPGVELEDVIRIRTLARKIGIKLHFLMIIGLPNDNVDGLYSTYRYLVKLHPDSAGFSIITPYPGTPMFAEAQKEGLIENFNWNNFRGDVSNMKTKYMSKNELVMGRFLLGLSQFSIRKGGLVEMVGLLVVELVFQLWKLLKRKY